MSLPRTTTAAVMTAQRAPLELMELTLPEIKPGQVMVEIAFSGICHTQLGEVRGKRGPDPYVPHCLGHEAGARVLGVGEGVTKVKPGESAVVTWIKGEGANVPGTVYQRADGGGAVNAGAVTTFMRHAVVSENRLVPVPADFPLDIAALLGCAVPTGAGAVLRTGRAEADESVAIFGLGGVGLSAMLAAVWRGCTPIIAVDVVAEKLDQALAIGATHTVNAVSEDVTARIKEITGSDGVDIAVEAAGVTKAMEAAYEATRMFGGRTVLAGNLAHGSDISIDPFPILLGRELLGAGIHNAVPDVDVPRYAEAFGEGSFKLRELISHVVGLGEVNQALDMLERGEVRRAVIDMERPVG
jgi:S-(hydroxymethyl)glutathione dehydrogenase / alcohol dehydrogenase